MKALTSVLATVLLLSLSPAAFAWSGRVHSAITRAAADAVPDDMKPWREYGKMMARASIEPDLWKAADPTEGPRHYIDCEHYPNVAITNLPADLGKVSAACGRQVVPSDGIAPWVIASLEQRLVTAMSSNDWPEATHVAYAMAHYVGDLHQPLHTTERFDNGSPPGTGIHIRWEEKMPLAQWRASMLEPAEGRYLGNPWRSILEWTAQAHAGVDPIYAADDAARAEANDDVESPVYYRVLWTKTSELFMRQTSEAATDLASLWYTAWVRAGRPRIPPVPESVSLGSVWVAGAPARPASWPYALVFLLLAVAILWMSIRHKNHPPRPTSRLGYHD